jgi:hypothetical protein
MHLGFCPDERLTVAFLPRTSKRPASKKFGSEIIRVSVRVPIVRFCCLGYCFRSITERSLFDHKLYGWQRSWPRIVWFILIPRRGAQGGARKLSLRQPNDQ